MMSRPATRRYAAVLLLVAAFGGTSTVAVHAERAAGGERASRPRDLVRASITRVQAVVRSDTGRDSNAQRAADIREIAETLFDFQEMSRRILARHWHESASEQQADFVRLLTNLLGHRYFDVIASGGWVGTSPDTESIDGSYALVRTRLGGNTGSEVSIEYRLIKRGERWAVYDVVHDGTSLVATYRSQLGSALRTSSFAELLERMRRNDAASRPGTATTEELGRRLLLLSVMTERGRR